MNENFKGLKVKGYILDPWLSFNGHTFTFCNHSFQILQTCKMFPVLKQLHCCFNSVEKLCLPSSLEQLTLLNLESNKVPSWDNVLQLASLSR